MTMQRQRYETEEGHSSPVTRQVSVFLDNRIGQLLRLTQVFDETEIRILGLSVVDSVDCAIVRIIFDQPDEAITLLRESRFALSVAEVLVVELPPGNRGLLAVCSTLLSSEVNINYAYPLLPTSRFRSAVAISVDNVEIAIDTLERKKFKVLGESDLSANGD